jgi:hypothetical protein
MTLDIKLSFLCQVLSAPPIAQWKNHAQRKRLYKPILSIIFSHKPKPVLEE